MTILKPARLLAPVLLACAWALSPAAHVTHAASGGYSVSSIPYSWEEINSPANQLTVTDVDDGYATLPVGFSFPFFGVPYTTVYASVNGFLTFDQPSSADGTVYQPDPIPSPTNVDVGGTAIGGWWTDLETCAPLSNARIHNSAIGPNTEAIYAKTVPASGSVPQHLVVEWDNVEYYDCNTGDAVTMEIKIFPDGTIQVHYNHVDNVDNDLSSSDYAIAIGVQDESGLNGVSYCYQNQSFTPAGVHASTSSSTTKAPAKSTPRPSSSRFSGADLSNCGSPSQSAIQFNAYVPSSNQAVTASSVSSYPVLFGMQFTQPSPGSFSGVLASYLDKSPSAWGFNLSACKVVGPNATPSIGPAPSYCRFQINYVSVEGCAPGVKYGTGEVVSGAYYPGYSTQGYEIQITFVADSGTSYSNGSILLTAQRSSELTYFGPTYPANVHVTC
jgi:hypothetical protein